MTLARKLLAAGAVAGEFDPLTDITWFDAAWADDPSWTNPGDGNNISTIRGNGTDGTDWTVATPSTRCYYTASAALLNNKGVYTYSTSITGTSVHFPRATFASTLTEPFSVVVIGYQPNDTNVRYFCDGIDATDRAIISGDANGGDYRFYTVANTTSTVAVDTNPHLFVGVSPATGDNKIYVDGTVSTASVAAESLPGSTMGNAYNGGPTIQDGASGFVGYYEGDITADGSWSSFETWVEDYYGLTIA